VFKVGDVVQVNGQSVKVKDGINYYPPGDVTYVHLENTVSYNVGDRIYFIEYNDLDNDGIYDECDLYFGKGSGTGSGYFRQEYCQFKYADTLDLDNDGLLDCTVDLCPNIKSTDNSDLDQDFIGDVCDDCVDIDGDGYGDGVGCSGIDNCPYVVNDQSDIDNDGVGDACDNCVDAYNPDQSDSDGNGIGDVCEAPSDSDGDGIDDVLDKCPNTVGYEEFEGCPYADEVEVRLHIVDQQKSGVCGYDKKGKPKKSCKINLEGIKVKVFDREDDDFVSIFNEKPKKNLFDNIYESDIGLVGECVTDSNGYCLIPEERLGKYLVIAKLYDEDNDISVYQGRMKNLKAKKKEHEEEEDDDDNEEGEINLEKYVKKKKLRFVKILKKDGSVKYEAGHRKIVKGSELYIDSPDYVVWDGNEELYPFIFSSDTNWSLNVCINVPAGYEIVGVLDVDGNIVSSSNCMQTLIAGEEKVLLFRVLETGSPEPDLSFSLEAEHEGKKTKIESEINGIRAENEAYLESDVNRKIEEYKLRNLKKEESAKSGLDYVYLVSLILVGLAIYLAIHFSLHFSSKNKKETNKKK
jgi:hypothetical protein